MTDWEWYDDIPTKVLWLHLLLRANHEDNAWRGRTIKRGQLITSVSHLAEETGLSVRQVRTALEHLKSTHELTTESTNRYTLVTLENYAKYQGDDVESDKPKTRKATSKGQTSDKQATTNKNEKNDKNSIYSGLPLALQEALKEFESMRKQIKKPVTSDNTRKRILSDLKKLADVNSPQAIAIVNQSTDRCWQGLYPLSKDYEVKTNTEEAKKNKQVAVEGLKQRLAELKAELKNAQDEFALDKSQDKFNKMTQLRTDIGRVEEMISKGEK